MTIPLRVLLFVLALISFNSGYGQTRSKDSLPAGATAKDSVPAAVMIRDSLTVPVADTFPKTVLVQLPSERNRIQALARAHKYKMMDEVVNDGIRERAATITDFERNFKYCPVYYFSDTNADLVKEKKFDGVLLNADGSTAIKPKIKGDAYVIAYYGYLSTKFKKGRSREDSIRQLTDAETPFGRGLVLTNDKFQEITYFYKLGYDDILWGLKKKDPEVHYKSKHFDIEYYPFAKLFNLKVLDRQYRFDFWTNYLMYKYNLSAAPRKKK